jgi:GNAT superfamily N-acetyltransferase
MSGAGRGEESLVVAREQPGETIDMNVRLVEATVADAAEIAELHTAVADVLTQEFGAGHWSSHVSEKGVLFALRNSRVFVAKSGVRVVGSLRLATTKPWAIDKSYFTRCERPLYLTAMAVEPSRQRTGFGRAMLDDAKRIARAWPGDAIRLDAYDAAAGAGEFYAKCGFREVGRVVYRTTPLIYYELILT